MDETALAGMVFTLLLTALIGGFILLFPLSRRFGLLLEAKLQEKTGVRPDQSAELQHLKESLQLLEGQVRLLNERQEFAEQLLARKTSESLPAADPGASRPTT